MLTPVDIQQKRFHVGLGYDKKDVNTFFEEVAKSYEELYRSNADLKDRVITLTEGLQNYKSKEAALEKSLMLAEKDSEDTKSRANKEAKNIKSEAKAQAQSILQEAEERLAKIKDEIALLETQYAAYKTNFCNLMKRQFEFMKEEDFDADAYIDEKALGVLVAAGGGAMPSGGASFGAYTGDPQMRDESTLGGMANGGSMGSSREELNSNSSVYTSHLGANDNFVDPFNPTSKGEGRYNPYDSLNPKKDRTYKPKEDDGDKKTSFTVKSNNRARRGPIPPQNQTSTSSSGYKAATKTADSDVAKEEPKKTYTEPVKEEPKSTYTEPVKEEPKVDPVTEPKYETDTAKEAEEGPIPTLNYGDGDGEAEVVVDVEEKINGRALLGEDDSSDDTDEFGFEFI